MTRDEVLEIEPGYKLDQLVGFVVYGGLRSHPFRPSVDYSDAFEVSKILDHFQLQRKKSGNYTVRWRKYSRTNRWDCVECETVTEAISKAVIISKLGA